MKTHIFIQALIFFEPNFTEKNCEKLNLRISEKSVTKSSFI